MYCCTCFEVRIVLKLPQSTLVMAPLWLAIHTIIQTEVVEVLSGTGKILFAYNFPKNPHFKTYELSF